MFTVSDEEFENMVSDAIDSIPDRFLDELENVVFIVEDELDEYQLERSGGNAELLGLYDGVNLLHRGNGYGAVGDYPDTITVFKGPHERFVNSREQLEAEVRKTVVHEVGHYFGMDEDQIADMGYA